jgi:hypothetical protein
MENTINYIYQWLLISVFAVAGLAIRQPALLSYDTWTKPYVKVDVVSKHKGFKFWWKTGKMRIKFK